MASILIVCMYVPVFSTACGLMEICELVAAFPALWGHMYFSLKKSVPSELFKICKLARTRVT